MDLKVQVRKERNDHSVSHFACKVVSTRSFLFNMKEVNGQRSVQRQWNKDLGHRRWCKQMKTNPITPQGCWLVWMEVKKKAQRAFWSIIAKRNRWTQRPKGLLDMKKGSGHKTPQGSWSKLTGGHEEPYQPKSTQRVELQKSRIGFSQFDDLKSSKGAGSSSEDLLQLHQPKLLLTQNSWSSCLGFEPLVQTLNRMTKDLKSVREATLTDSKGEVHLFRVWTTKWFNPETGGPTFWSQSEKLNKNSEGLQNEGPPV